MKARKTLRVAVPVGIGVASLGAALFTPSLASAQDPSLPIISRVELVQNMLSAKPTPYSGTVVATSNLFGSVSSLVGSAIPNVTLPQGTATVNVWKGVKDQLRAQLLNATSERDLYVNGRTVWLWDSSTMSAMHINVDASTSAHSTAGSRFSAIRSKFSAAALDPGTLAKEIMAKVSPYVNITVGQNDYIGGQPVYDLQLVPLESASLIRTINIFVDANNWHVLGVNVVSTSSSTPVLSSEFSAVSFSTPSPSVFSFTPPQGAKVQSKNFTVPMGSKPATSGLGSQRSEVLAKRFMSSKSTPKVATFGSGLTTVVMTAPGSYQSLLTKVGSKYHSLFAQVLTSYQTPFGSGKVLSTPLFNVMVLPNGQMVAGAVTLNQLAIDATMGYQP